VRTRRLSAAGLIAVIVAVASIAWANAAVPEYTAAIIRTFPHDPRAFTEGLLYRNGFLYESTGRSGQSSIREVILRTGEVVRQADIDPRYYGEGIAVWKNRLIQLTWKNEIGFLYDLNTFELRSTFHYSGEGWGLTSDSSHLIMSDGTSDLRTLDPNTFSEIGRVHVTCEGRAIHYINELEWVKGEVYANIWRTNLIARINPTTGEIVGLIDLTDLAASAVKPGAENVLNGIAYDAAADRLFVTGKYWPALYQIRLSPRHDARNLCQTVAPAAATAMDRSVAK
jgi:glutaminyl-peptide cyclotransferase